MRRRMRVLLVDDQEVVRHGLRRMLESEGDMEVVGDCASAEEAFSQVKKLSPDIVLMDAQMPGTNGIEATYRLKRNGLHCDADVIMLAESSDYLVKALEAGVAGYLLKDIKREELAQSIRQVYHSEHSLKEPDTSVEEAVELVIPTLADAAQTVRFISQVEGTLHVDIAQIVGSWDQGTVITILPKPDPQSNLLDKLRNMSDVEKVEEEPSPRDGFPSFLGKFGTLLRSETSPGERILITLNSATIPRQELAAVLETK